MNFNLAHYWGKNFLNNLLSAPWIERLLNWWHHFQLYANAEHWASSNPLIPFSPTMAGFLINRHWLILCWILKEWWICTVLYFTLCAALSSSILCPANSSQLGSPEFSTLLNSENLIYSTWLHFPWDSTQELSQDSKLAQLLNSHHLFLFICIIILLWPVSLSWISSFHIICIIFFSFQIGR